MYCVYTACIIGMTNLAISSADVSIEYKVGLIEAECRAALLEDEDAEERHENRSA